MIAPKLLRWYECNQRKLPWRGIMPHPYYVLVSEAMLQQTQVTTVIRYYNQFIRKFPALEDLAKADEQEVLRLWQGLGYYSRARNLHRAAKEIVRLGKFPMSVEELLELPGVGRYTAGAIASIAFDVRAPIVDGNVQRVICRLEGIADDPREKDTAALIWRRSEEILPRKRCGEFNSALMELGATVCTPRNPSCEKCPLNSMCIARRRNLVDVIPAKKKSKPTPLEKRVTLCMRRGDKFLIEQRPSKGRWAGLWQFITRPAEELGEIRGKRLGKVMHALTHRRYEFEAYLVDERGTGIPACHRPKAGSDRGVPRSVTGKNACPTKQIWVRINDLDRFPMSVPQLKIARMLDIAQIES